MVSPTERVLVTVRNMRRSIIAVGMGLVGVLTSCAGTVPEVGAGGDAALIQGRSIWSGACANCHGAAGGGGRGPQLNAGRVLDRYPDIEDQIALVSNGRGGMPAYDGKLSNEDIEAVVRYTREVIATVE